MSTPEKPRWLTPDERQAWLAAAALVVRMPTALDAQLQADAGLSFFEYMVLAVLSEQEDHSLQMSEIARFGSASLSRLSHTVKRLEREGYLIRNRVPGAGRRTRATLTDAGYDKAVASAAGHVATVRDLLIDAVTPAQLETLREIGVAVLNRIEADAEWPPPSTHAGNGAP